MADFLDTANPLASVLDNPTPNFVPNIYSNIFDGNSPYTVKIKLPNYMHPIYGLLTEPFGYSVGAKWEASGVLDMVASTLNLDGVYKAWTQFSGLNGYANPSNLGLSSKKIYTQSDYLEFGLKFRVVDWDGTGQPLAAAYMMTMTVLPLIKEARSSTELVVEIINGFLGAVTGAKQGNAAGEALDSFAALENKSLNGIQKWVNEGPVLDSVPMLRSTLNMLLFDNQMFILAKSPLPVNISIGSYFYREDMVVENVSPTFSKNMTESGPMFVDFDIKVSSRQALVQGDPNNGIGLIQTPIGKRVTENGKLIK